MRGGDWLAGGIFFLPAFLAIAIWWEERRGDCTRERANPGNSRDAQQGGPCLPSIPGQKQAGLVVLRRRIADGGRVKGSLTWADDCRRCGSKGSMARGDHESTIEERG